VPQSTHLERARALVRDVNEDAGADPIRIGIITPLSEPGDGTAGELVVRGACLGAEYVREHGGARDNRAIELVLYDDQATAAQEGMFRSAAGQMAKLALVDDVVAAMGQWHLRTTPWVVDVATKYDVPIFVENGYSEITAQKRRNVFRSYFSVTDRVPLMLDFAAELGIRTVGMVCADTAFGRHTADTLEQYGRWTSNRTVHRTSATCWARSGTTSRICSSTTVWCGPTTRSCGPRRTPACCRAHR
jgi:branched-chain amino acid transport system substrate-binding protein